MEGKFPAQRSAGKNFLRLTMHPVALEKPPENRVVRAAGKLCVSQKKEGGEERRRGRGKRERSQRREEKSAPREREVAARGVKTVRLVRGTELERTAAREARDAPTIAHRDTGCCGPRNASVAPKNRK